MYSSLESAESVLTSNVPPMRFAVLWGSRLLGRRMVMSRLGGNRWSGGYGRLWMGDEIWGKEVRRRKLWGWWRRRWGGGIWRAFCRLKGERVVEAVLVGSLLYAILSYGSLNGVDWGVSRRLAKVKIVSDYLGRRAALFSMAHWS